MMKILVIGSGGREHALVWRLAQSPQVEKIFCVPGNDGIAELASCVPISLESVDELLEFVKKEEINLTVVGPELPLSRGIVDEFEKAGQKIFGPRKNAAILEASKVYTKEFCAKYQIPTAHFSVFYMATDAKAAINHRREFPVVIKADGLAQGKGVVIAFSKEEAVKTIDEIMIHEKFGDSGRKIIIEDFLQGEEATFMIATDGRDFVVLESAQDHKRVFDNDQGPNTGGMGAYSPAPIVTKEVEKKIIDQIIRPTLNGMMKEDRPYKGILYAGLMIHEGEPKLIEFNCRFGDPEAQAILFRMQSDLVELILAVIDGKITNYKIKFLNQPAVCVVLSSEGYPGSYKKGKIIKGLCRGDSLSRPRNKNVFVFHAGTKREGGQYITHGGRVLGVTAKGKKLSDALSAAYAAIQKIGWEGMHYRKDIGRKGLP